MQGLLFKAKESYRNEPAVFVVLELERRVELAPVVNILKAS